MTLPKPITNGTFLDAHKNAVKDIQELLHSSSHILIGTHQRPDGDALGSCMAMYHALKNQGKDVTVYVPDPAPAFFSFIPDIEHVTHKKPDVSPYDTIVLLDYTQLYRTNLEDEAKRHPRTICIDHHYDNKQQANVNLVVGEAAATAHILYELFRALHIPIDQKIATCLLTGIFTDTGSFMHDSVTPELLHISADLMQKGARLSHIAHETYQRKDLPSLKIWGRALSRILISEKTGASVSVITTQDLEECGATLDDLDGAINMLNALPQTKFAMLLVEFENGKIKGSLRSEPRKGVDVSKIAARLGGGGHKLASGFEVQGHLVQRDGMWRIDPIRNA